jgi:tRNA dimethylallyltransferase
LRRSVDGPPLALVGPTAAGKTEAALALARALNAEIVSVDSMVVYRGLDMGTAKPSPAERAEVAHHLIDVAEPTEALGVARYQELGRDALAGIAGRGHRALLSGGSGLYLRALVDGLDFPGTDPRIRAVLEREAAAVGGALLYGRLRELDPVAAGKIEPSNVRRTVRALEVPAVTGRVFSDFAQSWDRYPPEHVRAAGVELPREVLAARIDARVHRMVAAGWLEEVEALVARGFEGWLTSTQAIGYAELARYLRGAMSLDDAIVTTVRRTRNLARRQMAWFRRDPRIHWFAAGPEGAMSVVHEIRAYLEHGA